MAGTLLMPITKFASFSRLRMKMKDIDEFKQQMQDLGGIKPLKQDQVPLNKPSSDEDPSVSIRQHAAVNATSAANPLSDSDMVDVGPHDVLTFKRDGVQHGVFKKLRMGKYNIDARLDLHRQTVAQARSQIYTFIKEAVDFDLRCVIILHGKGFHSKATDQRNNAKAVIKSYTYRWLKELPQVMAFHSAQAHHGGTGAVYVLLRKSDNEKQRNRERHGLR